MKTVNYHKVRKLLAVAWAAVFVAGVAEAIGLTQRFPGNNAEIWGWFTQTFAPLMGMIVTGLIAAEQSKQTKRMSTFFAGFTLVAVLVYGAFALATPAFDPDDPIKWLSLSAQWLGIGQGLAAALIAFAFEKSN